MDRAMRIALVLWQRINFGCDGEPPVLAVRSSERHRRTKHLSRFLQGLSSGTRLPPKRRAAADLETEGRQPGWRCRSLRRRQQVVRLIINSSLPNLSHFINSLKRDSSRLAAAESQLAENMARLVIVIAWIMSSFFNPHASYVWGLINDRR
jgi:hypothetical protein